ncbi:MAG: hypothetical protein RL659_474 [Pseudomonadota bacterium]|jgi:hypothetical protein
MQSCINIDSDLKKIEMLTYQKCLLSIVLLLLGLLPACGFISHQSVYEGIRGSEKAKTTGTSQKSSTLPNYDQYEKEREVLKK